MKAFYKTLIIIALACSPLLTKASHIAGGDWQYVCIGPNTFEVTLNLFRDCDGIGLGTTQSVSFTSPCGPTQQLVLTLQNGVTGTEVSQLCPTSLANSTCSGGTLPGMQQYIYTGVVILQPTCDSWTMQWSSCCRNNTILNITNPSSAGLVLPATLNSTADSCNNSPFFTAMPIPYVCQNQLVNYNFGVSELDGDSIVYSFVDPISSTAGATYTNVNWVAGYSTTAPLPGITLDTLTGQLLFIPMTQGNFVISVMACEYDYITGELKGCITRDIQFVVITCSNTPPEWRGFSNFNGTGVLVDSTTIEVCVGNNFSFELEYPDANPTDIVTATSNIATVLPGAVITNTPGNPAIIHVDWTTQSGTPPFNSFAVSVSDDACPIFGITSASYVIKVVTSTYAGLDKSICEGVEWAQLNAQGGSIFNWSVLSGSPIDTVVTSPGFNMTCQNCDAPQVSPQTTTTYVVTSNLSTSCQNTDTITITAAQNYVASSGPDTVVCSTDSMNLFSSATIPGPFTYAWDNYIRVSSDTVQNPKTFSTITTTYTVTMTSADGCVKTASNTIGKVPPVPTLNIDAVPANICQFGDSSHLLLELLPNFSVSCAPSLSPCGNQGYTTDIQLDYDPADGTSGPVVAMTTTTFPAPFGNSYKTGKQQYLYRASELQDMGLTEGMITELGFFVTALNGTAIYQNYSLSIGCSPLLSMPGTTFPTGLSEVFPAQNVNVTLGWNMLTFSSPYIWDGTSNLIVQICFDNRTSSATQNSITRTREFKPTTPGAQQFVSSLSYGRDDISVCDAQLALGSMWGGSFTRPDTRFTFCHGYDPAAYEFTWSPNLFINDTTIQGPTVWPDTTTTYNVVLADTFGVCTDTTSIEITVANFEAGPDTLVCAGDTIQLFPEVFDNCNTFNPIVYWYSNTGLGLISVNGIIPTISVDTTTTFFVQYTNFCSCTVTDSATVYVNNMGQPNLTFTEPACGASDGEILVQNNGGLAPFTFSTDSGQTFHVDSLFTNLPLGFYTTQYMDSNGCLSPMLMDTLINFNTPIIDSITTNTPLCFSTASGIIDIHYTGGQSPHTFSLDGGGSWGPNSYYNNLNAGTYVILVRDANLCVSWADTVTLASNNQLLFDSVQYTNLICFQDSSGTLNAFGHGGTLPYTFSIDSGFTYQTSNMFNTLHADTYQVVIMDAVGCTTIPFEQIIEDAPEMIANFSVSNDTCFNACGGSSSVSITGGTLPLVYTWRKGVNGIGLNSPSLEGLCAGTDYELSVNDANNCTQFFPFAITHPDEVIAATTVVNSSCFGSSDGSITVSGSGGVPPYRYSINNGVTFRSNPYFTGLAAGSYAIMVADSGMRCYGTTTAVIIEPNEIVLTTNISSAQVCVSGCTQLIATATGGSGGPYTYIWNQGFDSNATQVACPTQTTIYSVYAVDSAGCTSSPQLITLTMYDSILVDAGQDQNICPEESVTLNANASGGNNGSFNYQWTPVFGLNNGFIQSPVAQPSSSTLYTVKVTDNCETPAAYDSVWVNVHPNPTMNFFSNDSTSGCEPFNISLTNGSTPVQFSEWTISSGENAFTAHGFQVDLTDLNEGVYNVTLHVITPEGCSNDITKTDFFEVYPLPTAKFTMDPDQTTIFNTLIQFEDQSIGTVQAWQWDFATIGSSIEQSPLYELPADSGTFPITLLVTTDKLCQDEVTELLRIGSEYNMYVPNSFTPNGDGQNDVFAPRGIGMVEDNYTLQIYDRWGGLIFESNSLTQPWDGRYQGTTEMAQNGIYIWKIISKDGTDDSKSHQYTGTVNLLR